MDQKTASAARLALTDPWRVALEEAWESWRAGSLGIAAVTVNDEDIIVSRGRNRVLERPTEPRVLAGSMLAHAATNALAVIPFGQTQGLTVYTSLDPCLMCAATIVTIVMLKIGRVR
jgi:tRNA(adenine34) deaminase